MKLIVTKDFSDNLQGDAIYRVEQLNGDPGLLDVAVIDVPDKIGQSYLKLQAIADGLQQVLKVLYDNGEKV
jgi:hypothetical protein